MNNCDLPNAWGGYPKKNKIMPQTQRCSGCGKLKGSRYTHGVCGSPVKSAGYRPSTYEHRGKIYKSVRHAYHCGTCNVEVLW